MNQNKSISEAEWEIMRIVWDQSPVTSTTIIKALQNATGWMPTTVKTLLSRLVSKEILSFEKVGRSFYYTPKMTEEACVKSEIESVIGKIYGGGICYESQHFIIKGHSDDAHTETLAQTLETMYPKLTSDLEFYPSDRLIVYIHTSQKRLHSALGLLEGPTWLRAGHLWGMIHLAPKHCFDDIAPDKMAVHTLSLLLTEKINPSAPYWLHQGIASYESGWLTQERIFKVLPSRSILAEMQKMQESYLSFKAISGYELSYSVVDFIVRTYGINKLSAFIRKPYNFLDVFGESEELFWHKWEKSHQEAMIKF